MPGDSLVDMVEYQPLYVREGPLTRTEVRKASDGELFYAAKCMRC